MLNRGFTKVDSREGSLSILSQGLNHFSTELLSCPEAGAGRCFYPPENALGEAERRTLLEVLLSCGTMSPSTAHWLLCRAPRLHLTARGLCLRHLASIVYSCVAGPSSAVTKSLSRLKQNSKVEATPSECVSEPKTAVGPVSEAIASWVKSCTVIAVIKPSES